MEEMLTMRPLWRPEPAGQDAAAGMEHAARVDGKHPVPVGGGEVGKELLLGDARVVDQRVDVAEAFFGGGSHRLDGGGVGDVGAVELRVAAEGGELVQKRAGRGLVFVPAGRDGIALPRKGEGARRPMPRDAPVIRTVFIKPPRDVNAPVLRAGASVMF